jgi:hypothetical protein
MEFLDSLVHAFLDFWPHLLSATYLVLMVVAAAHVVMYKKDTRAATGWIGLIVMVPLAGPILYWMLGINRLARKAVNPMSCRLTICSGCTKWGRRFERKVSKDASSGLRRSR